MESLMSMSRVAGRPRAARISPRPVGFGQRSLRRALHAQVLRCLALRLLDQYLFLDLADVLVCQLLVQPLLGALGETLG